MRIALVSPYSWTYPGGVTRHVEALAEHLIAAGHDARILAPFDPDDARSRRMHRGVAPEAARAGPAPGRAGAHDRAARERRGLERRALAGGGVPDARRAARWRLRRRPRPRADRARDLLGRGTAASLPLVGTFHTYSTNRLTNNLGNLAGASRRFHRLHVRIAVSGAARVDRGALLRRALPRDPQRRRGARADRVARGARRRARSARCASRSSARRSSARGCRSRCAAFAALREHVPARLDLVGVEQAQLDALIARRAPASSRTAASATSASSRCSRPPTCWSRRRSAARASGWC